MQFFIIINVKYNYNFFFDCSFSISEVRQATRNPLTFISVEIEVNQFNVVSQYSTVIVSL